MKEMEINEKTLRKYYELKAIIRSPKADIYGYLSEIIPEFKELLDLCESLSTKSIETRIKDHIKNLEYYKPTNYESTITILKDILK